MSGADKEVRVKLSLDSTGLVTGAKAGTEQLEKLKEQIEGDTRELGALQKAMKTLQAATTPNTEAIDKLKRVLQNNTDVLADAKLKFIGYGGDLNKIGVKVKDTTKSLDKMRKAQADTANTQKQQAASGAAKLRSELKTLGVVTEESSLGAKELSSAVTASGMTLRGVGLVAGTTVAAVTAVGYAAYRAIEPLYAFAEANANARRSEMLHLEGLTSIRNFFGVARGSAVDVRNAIDAVAQSSALSRDKIAGYAEQLYAAGLRGQNLQAALEGTAMKAAVQGDAMAGMFMQISQAVALSGGSVTKLAAKVKQNIGGIAKAQLLDTNVQAQKLRESFAHLTDGLKLDKLLVAKQSLFSLFSTSTASGKALQNVVSTFGQLMIDGATRGWSVLRPILQDWVYYLLRIENLYLRGSKAYRDFTTGADLTAGAKRKNALNRAGVDQQIRQNAIGGAPRPELKEYLQSLQNGKDKNSVFKGTTLLGALENQRKLQAKPIAKSPTGTAITDGLRLGVDLHALDKPLDKTALNGIEQFKKTIDAHSPSRVFAKLGASIPEGVAVGISDNYEKMQRAIDELHKPQKFEAPAVEQSIDVTSKGSAPITVTIGQITVTTQATDAAGIGKSLRVELENVLRNVQLQGGV